MVENVVLRDEKKAAQAWIRGELKDEIGDPAPTKIACLWCGKIVDGGREGFKQHAVECELHPLMHYKHKFERLLEERG
jgi:hypothetical protein